MLILVPTYYMKIFIGQTAMTTYVIPFVIGMLLVRDSIVGILIPSSISLLASLFTRSAMHHPATNSLATLLARLIVGERSNFKKIPTHTQDHGDGIATRGESNVHVPS